MGGGASSLGSAAAWIEAVIQGPVMNALAAIAIAAVGLAMLRGQLSVRRGVTVVLGCFVAFGAPSIARGLTDLARAQDADDGLAVQAIDATPPPNLNPPVAPALPANVDPYAGASVRN